MSLRARHREGKCAQRLGVRQRSRAKLPPSPPHDQSSSWHYRTPRRLRRKHSHERSSSCLAASRRSAMNSSDNDRPALMNRRSRCWARAMRLFRVEGRSSSPAARNSTSSPTLTATLIPFFCSSDFPCGGARRDIGVPGSSECSKSLPQHFIVTELGCELARECLNLHSQFPSFQTQILAPFAPVLAWFNPFLGFVGPFFSFACSKIGFVLSSFLGPFEA